MPTRYVSMEKKNDGDAGFPQALEIMENLENNEKKVPCMEKSWNLCV